MDFIAEKRVNKYPYYTEGDDIEPEWRNNPDHMSIHRRDTQDYLGTVGSNYGIVQYPDLFKFTEVLVDQDLAGFKYAGISGNGAQAYIVMETAKCINLGPGDDVSCFFYVATSHNPFVASFPDHTK